MTRQKRNNYCRVLSERSKKKNGQKIKIQKMSTILDMKDIEGRKAIFPFHPELHNKRIRIYSKISFKRF